MEKIFDRAGYQYDIVANVAEATKQGLENYVTFKEDGTPVVIRQGVPVLSSFFTDGNGCWARLINSTIPKNVDKALKKRENPAIVLHNGEIICQFIPLIGILWHDDKGNKFYLVSRFEREEMEADHLGYLTAESDGTYENLEYIAYDGVNFVTPPRYLYNEKNRKFTVGVNFKKMAYAEMQKRGNASIAIKNALRPIYARLSEEGEFIMAHTFGAYEAQKVAHANGSWFVEYCEGGNGSWEVSQEEFFKRYEFHSVADDGRAIFIAKAERYVWCHLFGDFIGCIPMWDDSMVAVSNPQINITNPKDVYACSYVEFFGKEDIPGSYIVIEQLFIGAPEPIILEFAEALKGYLTATFGIPKNEISASNLSVFLRETIGVPTTEGIQTKVAQAIVG